MHIKPTIRGTWEIAWGEGKLEINLQPLNAAASRNSGLRVGHADAEGVCVRKVT